MYSKLRLHATIKEWTMSSMRSSNSGCTGIVRRAQRQRKRCSRHSRERLQLPKCYPNYSSASRIGWTHIRHCPLPLYHSKTFFMLKSRFFCTNKNNCKFCTCTCTCCFQWQHFSQHIHVQVLFSTGALSLCRSLDASDVSETISDTFSKSPKSSRNQPSWL